MTIYKKDLQSLNKDIKDLGRTIDKLIKEFDKGKKTKVTKKVTAKSTKAKTTKKAPAKKAPAKKKPAKLTATDKVLKIIRGSKKGVDTSTLMKMTGFNQKKSLTFSNGHINRAKSKEWGKGFI